MRDSAIGPCVEFLDMTDEQAMADTLADHFPTGLRSTLSYLPQTGEVFESPIRCECHCGETFAATDEQEARFLWAEHAAAALKARSADHAA